MKGYGVLLCGEWWYHPLRWGSLSDIGEDLAEAFDGGKMGVTGVFNEELGWWLAMALASCWAAEVVSDTGEDVGTAQR